MDVWERLTNIAIIYNLELRLEYSTTTEGWTMNLGPQNNPDQTHHSYAADPLQCAHEMVKYLRGIGFIVDLGMGAVG